MTPLQNGNAAAGPNGHRSKRSTGRVQPAIPLAFSRPKQQPRHQFKVSSHMQAAAKASTPATRSPSISEKGQNGMVERLREEEEQDSRQVLAAEEGSTRPSAETLQAPSQGDGAMSTSLEAPPDAVANEAATNAASLTNGRTAASSVAGTDSPASGRRTADRFDIRHLRTELPPAFIPSAEQPTPLSAAGMQQNHPATFPHGHPIHPSAGSIVFGGNDSSASSPAPPPGMNSAFVPPPFGPAPAQNYNHAHHASEPLSQHLPNGSHAPPPFAGRGAFHPPPQFTHPHAQAPFRYPLRGDFTPNGAGQPNGYKPRSRSGSHASSRAGVDLQSPIGLDQSVDSAKAFYPDGKPTFANRNIPPPFQAHMGPPPTPFHHPEVAIGMENAESMRDHILSQFRSPAFADCQLHVVEQDSSAQVELDGHRLVFARSPRLAELIIVSSIQSASSPPRPRIEVSLTNPHLRIGPFVDSVRYLYGGSLPPIDLYNLLPHTSIECRVETALQYIATGSWLKIHAVAQRGVEIASYLIQWDTITHILAFALSGGLAPMWSSEDGVEEKTSTCSSDDSSTKPEAGGSPTYEAHSSALLNRVLEFAAHNFPPSFYIDASAPQSDACPRLPQYPQHHESKSSRSDPRLSKIRFGEMANDLHQRPSFTTTALSSILLSLPFPLLKYLLEHPALATRLGADTAGSIMRQVVNEREVRRQKALEANGLGRDDGRAEHQQIQNLYWEETVEPTVHTRAGFRLSRRKRGIDTPQSSSEADVPK